MPLYKGAFVTAMNDVIVSLKGVTKYFGRLCAVNNMDLSLRRGEIYGLVGVNGAGKTTTLRMILGLIPSTRGNISVYGHDPVQLPNDVRSKIGYVAERHPLYKEMTIGSLAKYQSSFFRNWNQKTFESLAYAFGLGSKNVIRRISNGQRAQVYLAMVLAQHPELLIMDDPTLGIDPIVRKQFLETVAQVVKQTNLTVMFSSHIIADIERIADHLFVMSSGHLIAACSIESFRRRVKPISVTFKGDIPALSGIKNVRWVREDGNNAVITIIDCDDDVISQLKALGATEIRDVEASLEDLFIDFTAESYLQYRAEDMEAAT